MDNKSCQSSADSTITSSSSSSNSNAHSDTTATIKDHYLKQLNRLSHKIAKPTTIPPNTTIINRRPSLDSNSQNFGNQTQPAPQSMQPHDQLPPPPPQQQPPVYNINKNDFRDVVQKLTGSPAHERISTPPPIQPPKPPSSRLQRIRPPPLAQVSNRPPPMLNRAMPPPCVPQPLAPPPQSSIPSSSAAGYFPRPSSTPLSPLPPFPAVHAAAESPVSAYMRYLQNSIPDVDSSKLPFSGFSQPAPLISPRWNSPAPPPPLPEQKQFPAPPPSQQGMIPQSQPPFLPQFQLQNSQLGFGCLNSPRSPYALLSPSLLLSPSSFPLSPTLPVPSPRWRGF